MKLSINFIFRIALILFIGLFFLTGCRISEPTKDSQQLLDNLDAVMQKYDSIKLGMSDAEVTAVMGSAGEDPYFTHTPKPGQPPLPKGFLNNFLVDDFEMGIAYANGKVIIKSLNWKAETLFDIPAPLTSVEKYDQVKVGMSIEEVSSLLGSSGIVWSIKNSARPGMDITGSGIDVEVNTFTTDYNTTTYIWRPEGDDVDKFDSMLITFSNGKVMMKSYKGTTIAE